MRAYWEYENFGEDRAKQDMLGAFYTPETLIKQMTKYISQYKDKTFYDPTFGYCAIIGYILDKKLDEGESVDKAITEVYGCELDKNVYNKGIKKIEHWAKANGATQKAIDIMKTHFVNMDTLEFDPIIYWDNDGNVRQTTLF